MPLPDWSAAADDAERRRDRRRRRRAWMNESSEVAWMVLSWAAVVGMIALVVLLVLMIGLCAGIGGPSGDARV